MGTYIKNTNVFLCCTFQPIVTLDSVSQKNVSPTNVFLCCTFQSIVTLDSVSQKNISPMVKPRSEMERAWNSTYMTYVLFDKRPSHDGDIPLWVFKIDILETSKKLTSDIC